MDGPLHFFWRLDHLELRAFLYGMSKKLKTFCPPHYPKLSEGNLMDTIYEDLSVQTVLMIMHSEIMPPLPLHEIEFYVYSF